eukprot:3164375-Alexandrium_andersonii.AAC.1
MSIRAQLILQSGKLVLTRSRQCKKRRRSLNSGQGRELPCKQPAPALPLRPRVLPGLCSALPASG